MVVNNIHVSIWMFFCLNFFLQIYYSIIFELTLHQVPGIHRMRSSLHIIISTYISNGRLICKWNLMNLAFFLHTHIRTLISKIPNNHACSTLDFQLAACHNFQMLPVLWFLRCLNNIIGNALVPAMILYIFNYLLLWQILDKIMLKGGNIYFIPYFGIHM